MSCTIYFLLLTVATATATAFPANEIHLLMPRSGFGGLKHTDIDCLSWRLAVETNNLQNWILSPECENYVGHYMLGKQYRNDCDLVSEEAYEYAKGLNITTGGMDVWVFDVDETTLSNLPYYARDTAAFGAKPYNETAFDAWIAEGTAPAIPGPLKLYKRLVNLGFKIVFLTGTKDIFTEIRVKNLKAAGYTTWEKLILKGDDDGSGFKASKRKALEEAGYKIRGNMGDQWSDLLGSNPGDRIFKFPDPMYYLG